MVFVVFFFLHQVHVSMCPESHSRSGGWETAAGQGPGLSVAMQMVLLPSSSDSRAPTAGPRVVDLGEMSYTLGIKTITSKRDGHRCRRLVSRTRAQKLTKQKITTLKASTQ